MRVIVAKMASTCMTSIAWIRKHLWIKETYSISDVHGVKLLRG